MSLLNVIPAKAGTSLVDGVDVAQLLREIGEASASNNAVTLFGLLMDAQRVLVHVRVADVNLPAPGEAMLLEHYRSTDADGRYSVECVAKTMAKHHPRYRPSLSAVTPIKRSPGAEQ